MRPTGLRSPLFVILLFSLGALACDLSGLLRIGASKPLVVINSPPNGSQFHDGEAISVQSTSFDPTGIARVEMQVDGSPVTVSTSSDPKSQISLVLVQTWKAKAGPHLITLRAFNAAGDSSDPVSISVSVLQAGLPTITPTLQALATPTSAFPIFIPLPPIVSSTLIPNRIRNFRGESLSAREARVMVDYTYNGEWGLRNLFLAAYADSGTGRILEISGEIPILSIGDGSGTVNVTLNDVGTYQSRLMVVCIYQKEGAAGTNFCVPFDFVKSWSRPPTATPTRTPTRTLTNTPTLTPTNTPTRTPTNTPTLTLTPTTP